MARTWQLQLDWELPYAAGAAPKKQKKKKVWTKEGTE